MNDAQRAAGATLGADPARHAVEGEGHGLARAVSFGSDRAVDVVLMGERVGDEHHPHDRREILDRRLDGSAASLPLLEDLDERHVDPGIHLGLGPRVARDILEVAGNDVGRSPREMGHDVPDTPRRRGRRLAVEHVVGQIPDEIRDPETDTPINRGVVDVSHGSQRYRRL